MKTDIFMFFLGETISEFVGVWETSVWLGKKNTERHYVLMWQYSKGKTEDSVPVILCN